MATTISTIFNKTLFQRLLISIKSNTNSGYLKDLELEKTGYVCDDKTGNINVSNGNCLVKLMNVDNKTKINLTVFELSVDYTFIRICYFNNDTFISGILAGFSSNGTKTYNIPENTTTIRLSTEINNLNSYKYELD